MCCMLYVCKDNYKTNAKIYTLGFLKGEELELEWIVVSDRKN